MTFPGLYRQILANQESITNGDVNFLPLYDVFPSIKRQLPGLIKSEYLTISGSTGTGKTKFTHFLVSTFLKLKLRKPKLKINVIYNSLEESVEKFKSIFLLQYLKEHGESINYYQLMGYSETKMTDRQVKLVQEATLKFDSEVDPFIDVVTNNSTVSFYEYVIGKLKAKGTFTTQGKYIPNDPNEWFIVVSDHIGCYQAEPGMNLFETLRNFSVNLSRVNLGLNCGCVVINIQQQVSTKEQLEINVTPKTFIEKVKPSIDGLNLYKNTSQDASVIIGVFNPHKWKEHLIGGKYNGIDLNELESKGQRIRSLCFLKTREGLLEDKELVVGFDGATNQFYELNTF